MTSGTLGCHIAALFCSTPLMQKQIHKHVGGRDVMNNTHPCLHINLNYIKPFSTRDAARRMPFNGTLTVPCACTTDQPHLGFLEWQATTPTTFSLSAQS